MKKKLIPAGILVVLFVIAAFLRRPVTHPVFTGFAVVELFTSEGCSSCPPADLVLAQLAPQYKDLYVLAYHVDYWEKLGWKDPYSSADYTQRQQDYQRVFKLHSMYTPQAVVDGRKELVGSDELSLRSDIETDLKRPAGKTIGLHVSSEGKHIKVAYTCSDPGDGALVIALVQSHAQTQVRGGENSDKLLTHVNVVRELRTAPAAGAGSVDLDLPDGLQGKDCRVIAFLQNRKSGDLSIQGAAGAEVQ